MKKEKNGFQVFFESYLYADLKNLFYNYRLRKRVVTRYLRSVRGPILEIGSGLSPMITGSGSLVVHTDLSISALWLLRHQNPNGLYVVADAECLPFISEAFSDAVCSEVFEHIENDGKSISELERVITDGGCLVATFPHRQCYYSIDDRFVFHIRRYELAQMKQKLISNGFKVQRIEKVLGPLDKATMVAIIGFIALAKRWMPKRRMHNGFRLAPRWLILFFELFNRYYASLIWLDAKIMPQSIATVLLILAEKECCARN